MTLIEAVRELQERPGYLAVLETGRVFRLSRTGRVMDATKPGEVYMRFTAAECLAVTWACWTPDQIQAMAAQAASQQT